MNWLITALGGKKLIVSLASIIAAIVVTLLKPKIDVSEELIQDLILAILGIAGLYNVGQGVADGLSKGATSHVKGTPGTPAAAPKKK